MRDEDKQKHYELAEKLLAEQNLTAAMIAGAVSAVLATVAYVIVVRNFDFAYGFAAAGIGVVVGFFVGFLGRGVTSKFTILAAAYTITGCAVGSIVVDNFTPMQLIYWFVAVAAAIFLGKRSLSREERLALGLYEIRS